MPFIGHFLKYCLKSIFVTFNVKNWQKVSQKMAQVVQTQKSKLQELKKLKFSYSMHLLCN